MSDSFPTLQSALYQAPQKFIYANTVFSYATLFWQLQTMKTNSKWSNEQSNELQKEFSDEYQTQWQSESTYCASVTTRSSALANSSGIIRLLASSTIEDRQASYSSWFCCVSIASCLLASHFEAAPYLHRLHSKYRYVNKFSFYLH